MSKKHKKRKPSRRARRGQPRAAAPEASKTPETPQPQPAVTTTFKPAEAAAPVAKAPVHESANEEAEFTSVRKDLRKLGVTILVFAALVAGLAVVNDQTGFVENLGRNLFHLWQ